MSEFSRHKTLDGLSIVNADLVYVDFIGQTADVRAPELVMEGGEEKDWELSFDQGRLGLGLAQNEAQVSGIHISGGDVVISGSTFRGSHIVVNGRTIIGGELNDNPPRTALLRLPPDYKLEEQNLQTVSGEINVIDVQSNFNRFKSVSGDVIVRKLLAGTLRVKTVSGDIEVDESTVVDSEIESVSGDIRIRNSQAPVLWRLKTVSGDIDTRSSTGQVSSRTVSGKVRS